MGMIESFIEIPDVKIINFGLIFKDDRGYFSEIYDYEILKRQGFDKKFVRENQSFSKKYVLRGMHYQINRPQGKLVRILNGVILDFFVDLRKKSDTFGKWGKYLLTEGKQIYIPEGFAHGFYALTETKMIYKMTDYYFPEFERTLAWNDPDINIKWPFDKYFKPIMSEKDSLGKYLKDLDIYE